MTLGMCELAVGQGALPTPDSLLVDEYEYDESAGFASWDDLPTEVSLLPFAPETREQEGSSCYSFSAGYCAFSTIFNAQFGITEPIHKELLAFDPYFIFTWHKNQNRVQQPCESGMWNHQVSSVLENVGCMRDIMSPDLGCDFLWGTSRAELGLHREYYYAATPFRGMVSLHSPHKVKSNRKWLKPVKLSLANNMPVLVELEVMASWLDSLKTSFDNNGNWKFIDLSDIDSTDFLIPNSHHAMCIVGYDDNRNGGALCIRNSWGSDWGHNGNVWVTYDDFEYMANWVAPITPYYYYENFGAPDQFDFELQSAGPDFEYVHVKGRGGVFEGFIARDNRAVTGIELYEDGSGYFGLFTNKVKNGIGMFCSVDGTRTRVCYINGNKTTFPEDFVPSNAFEQLVWNQVAMLETWEGVVPGVTHKE